MPKSPGENSSGEAVTGGRERGSSERYCSQETGKLGRGKGRRGEYEDRKYSVTAQGAVSSEQDSHLPGYTQAMGNCAGAQGWG